MLEQILLLIGLMLLVLYIGFMLLVAKGHKKVAQGKALIRTGFGGAKVALDSGMFVIPILHKVEEMDISIRTILVETQITTKDNERVDLRIQFFVRVNKDPERIIEVAQSIGCEKAGKQEFLENLFQGKFLDAVHTIGTQFNLEDLLKNRDEFKKHILREIPEGINGFVLDDCAIEKMHKVPDNHLGEAVFVLLDIDKPLEKGEKVVIVDKINGGKSYIVRRMLV